MEALSGGGYNLTAAEHYPLLNPTLYRGRQAQGMGQGTGEDIRAAAWGLLLGDTGSCSPASDTNLSNIYNSGSS